ncbi:MAG: tail-specific protease [Bacteroidetes bacterium RIFCSPLOWO2_12_FULL_35_15]|nr:MAG: tail-specific protease [Bacteroidetes bacterium RIFCSPLOWO2_12_FULL_35_15]
MLKNKKLLLLIPVALVAIFSYAFIATQTDKDQAIDQILMQSLKTMHYSPKEINDDFSQKVFKLYTQRLDYNKKFLIQSDIDDLKKMDRSIDDDITAGKFTFFEKSFEIINKRIDEAQEYYKKILDKPFDFSKDETVELDAEKLSFSKSKDDLKDAWRKSLKYQTLAKIIEMTESQEKAKEKSDTVKIKTKEELEVDARKKVLKNNDDYFKRLKELNHNDRLSIYFNSITGIYDPHTEYFAPKDKANFDISMSGQLEGIGAQLQEKDGYTKVSSIVPGSASWKQGQLKAGDIILKVGQGAADPVDIVDMRLDNVVQLVRGKKGTEVRLTVKKPDGSIIVIPIIRDIVVLEDSYAQSVILKGKKNIGYIKLPSFYADFNGKGGRSCSKDIKKELEKLKAENVDGVILDLRYNGGGSLGDVVDMAGLFIDKGPIVQVKQKEGAPQVMEDKDPSIVYDGPFTVMVNSNSASASEIMAAAIQDYHRGVIVGTSPSTFGKGTVQRFYDMDDYLPPQYADIKPIGQVKITTQKFYRINGGATQLKGVIPDIILPDPYYLLDQGEKEQDYPMVWDEINPAHYAPLKPSYSVEKLKTNSLARIKNNESFAVLEEAAKRLKKQKDSTVVSLNFDKYVAEQKRLKAEYKKMENLDKEIVGGVDVVALKADAFPESDTVKIAKNKDWYKAIKKDLYLNETVQIMNEMK